MKKQIRKWNPRQKTVDFLQICWNVIQTVDYSVPVRWVFYRLIQDFGLPKTHAVYRMTKERTAKARKLFYKEWRPWTLTDESRSISVPDGYKYNAQKWINETMKSECYLDSQQYQDYHVIVVYEARAMHQQFIKYTQPYRVPLVPLGGDPSIPHKWTILELIVRASKLYKVPIVILYYGDCDEKGEQIPNTVRDDIISWTKSGSFKWVRVGLNKGDGERLGLPVRPDKPTQYQWEALSDEQARTFIEGSLNEYLDLDKIKRVEREEKKLMESYQSHMKSWRPPIYVRVQEGS